jgi:serine/threonine protein kinase
MSSRPRPHAPKVFTFEGFRSWVYLQKGGQGIVASALHTDGLLYAVKIVPLTNAAARSRAMFEADLAIAMRHPYVTHTLGFFVSNSYPDEVGDSSSSGSSECSPSDAASSASSELEVSNWLYIVMRLFNGTLTVRHVSPDAMGSNVEIARRVLTEMSFALQYLHSKGYIHGDVKPSNILKTLAVHWALGDFGLSSKRASFVGRNVPPTGKLLSLSISPLHFLSALMQHFCTGLILILILSPLNAYDSRSFVRHTCVHVTGVCRGV